MALWRDITADEEKRGEVFIRHQPTYRLEKLNAFLSRFDTKRQIGTPISKSNPSHAKNWMIKKRTEKTNGGNTGHARS